MEPLIDRKTSAQSSKKKIKKNGSLNDENNSSDDVADSHYGATQDSVSVISLNDAKMETIINLCFIFDLYMEIKHTRKRVPFQFKLNKFLLKMQLNS